MRKKTKTPKAQKAPKFKVGDQVAYSLRGKVYVGYVQKIIEDRGRYEYYVAFPQKIWTKVRLWGFYLLESSLSHVKVILPY